LRRAFGTGVQRRAGLVGDLKNAGVLASGMVRLRAYALGATPIRISVISAMPFWSSLPPWAKGTPAQLKIRMPRIHHGGFPGRQH
jgi:hypothetical protein